MDLSRSFLEGTKAQTHDKTISPTKRRIVREVSKIPNNASHNDDDGGMLIIEGSQHQDIKSGDSEFRVPPAIVKSYSYGTKMIKDPSPVLIGDVREVLEDTEKVEKEEESNESLPQIPISDIKPVLEEFSASILSSLEHVIKNSFAPYKQRRKY